jgi:hypothetical protein
MSVMNEPPFTTSRSISVKIEVCLFIAPLRVVAPCAVELEGSMPGGKRFHRDHHHTIKSGPCQIQIWPVGVETSQYPILEPIRSE